MIFIDLAAWILFLFLTIYVINQLYITSCSSRGRIRDIEKRNYVVKFKQKINIIVYSHNNASTIIDLVESLKRQDYDADKYSINVILDNCVDNSAKLLEILGGTRLWRINTDIKPIGRNKAIAWLLERILSSENTNAFVFINADCVVKPDFLARINAAIYDNPVLMGEVLPSNTSFDLISRLVSLKNKIKNKVVNHGRYYAGLYNILDEDVCAIRQDILEKVRFSITDYGFEEYEFSVKLANANIPVSNSYQIYCYKPVTETFRGIALLDYKKRYKALSTFRNNLMILFSNKNLKAKELVLSLIYPSGTTFIILALVLFNLSIYTHTLFSRLISPKIVLMLVFVHLFTKMSALLVSRCTFNEYKAGALLAFLTPVLFAISHLQGVKLNMSFKFSLPRKLLVNKDFHKQLIETTVSDGKKELPCKLEIRQNEAQAQLIFMFNDKKLTSAKYPTIDRAFAEIIEKLKSHGFNLKICMNCGYFNSDETTAARFGGEQGYCLFDNVNKNSRASEYTYIWNFCSNVISAKTRKHILKKLVDAEKDEVKS